MEQSIFDRLEKAGLVEKDHIVDLNNMVVDKYDSMIRGIETYLVENPNNEIAKRWLKELLAKKINKSQTKEG